MLELKPGLADRGGIGPVAEDRSILTIERTLAGQLIDAFQQGRPGEGRFSAGMPGACLIDRLGNSRLVLVELLEGPLEVGIGVGGAGHEASDGVNPQDVIRFAQPQSKPSAGY